MMLPLPLEPRPVSSEISPELCDELPLDTTIDPEWALAADPVLATMLPLWMPSAVAHVVKRRQPSPGQPSRQKSQASPANSFGRDSVGWAGLGLAAFLLRHGRQS